ncbi:p37NB protein [Anopheles darlingi]|uniref:p37NB protein n=1 Tax=Anopheles darlingi TaxID=43151 RepID=W5J451_ANODA|nr:p37NB protein [Anopheles darlingi]
MSRVWFMFLPAVLAALFVTSEAAIIRLTCEISDGKCLLKNIFATEDDRFKEIRNEGYRDIIDFFDCHIHTLPPIPFIRKVKADAINLVRIEENTFSTITVLDVSYNRLREISPKAFEWPKELHELNLSAMEDLSKLDMSNNRIASIPVGMFAQLVGLNSLDLSHNSIAKIAAGALAIDGQRIDFDLSYNNISIIENNAFMHASKINLRNNKLLGVGPYAFDNQTNLGTLILSGNVQLKNFDFLHNLPNLHTLEMSGMNFSFDGIPRNMFDDLVALATLDLSHNRISELPIGIFAELQSLNFVNLRHNLIKHIEFGTFSMRKYDLIDEIDLSYNEIEEMNFLVFVPLKYLKTLLLHGNKITYVNAKQLIRNKSLQNFGIQKNLVRCYDLVDLLGSLKLVLDQDEFISDQPNVDGIKCEP